MNKYRLFRMCGQRDQNTNKDWLFTVHGQRGKSTSTYILFTVHRHGQGCKQVGLQAVRVHGQGGESTTSTYCLECMDKVVTVQTRTFCLECLDNDM